MKFKIPILCLCIISAAYADTPINFSFEVSSGMLYGQTGEYFFCGETLISKLTWDEKWIPTITSYAQVDWSAFRACAQFFVALPLASGIMEDFDYLIPETTQASLYSQHPTKLDKHIAVSASLGYEYTFSSLRITPAVGFSYKNRKWTAHDGYTQYPKDGGVWTGTEEKKEIQGNVVSYEQNMYYPFVSLDVAYSFNKYIDLTLCASLYPYLFIDTLDTHFLRYVQFIDSMRGGFGYNAGVSFRYNFAYSQRHISLILRASYEYLSCMNGITASVHYGVRSNDVLFVAEGYSAGTDEKLCAISISFAIIL